jgi:hypothetical protein
LVLLILLVLELLACCFLVGRPTAALSPVVCGLFLAFQEPLLEQDLLFHLLKLVFSHSLLLLASACAFKMVSNGIVQELKAFCRVVRSDLLLGCLIPFIILVQNHQRVL